MKKVLLSLTALLIAGVGFAQTAGQPPVSFGIKAGPNFSSYTSKSSGNKQTSKLKVGLEAGAYANISLADEFYFQPSLLYAGKGGKDKNSDTKINLSYLELPLDFLFKPDIGNGNKFIVGVGPYVAYGIGGSVKGSTPSYDPFKSYNGTDASLKRFDAGANVQLGYEMPSGFNVGLNTDLGLVNALNHGDNNNSFRNTSFAVTVGYTFKGR
ncbi:MAG TPA: porin family protein [Chitinophagaceae bacterium]